MTVFNATTATDPAVAAVGYTGPKLQVEGLSFDYAGTAALRNVDLSIGEGEFVSLLGPSGCGKTTLLRIVAGLLQPRSGQVRLDGRDITNLPPEKRPLNMVFQHLALFPHLSVGENVGFGLSLAKIPRKRIRERVAQTLQLVGLEGFEDRSVQQVSGGQQQRVALARALITEPSILLLDEPLGALDFAIRKEMQAELKALQRRLKITFVFVTHDQTEAMSMSDRVVLMSAGQVVQDASPLETYSNPASVFAAGFVGDTNLLKGQVVRVDDDLSRVQIGTGAFSVNARLVLEGHVIVSIRPEHIALVATDDAGSVFTGEITAESFRGADVYYDILTSAGTLRVREACHAESLGRIGEVVGVVVDPRWVRVFTSE